MNEPRYKVVSVTGWKIIPNHQASSAHKSTSYTVLDTHVCHRIVQEFIPHGGPNDSSVACERKAREFADRLNLEDTQREAA